MPLQPSMISAVSASSALACAMACRTIEFAIDCFKTAIQSNRKNFYPSRLFSDGSFFPHARIYRDALLQVFDQLAIEKLHAGPDIQVLITRTSDSLPKYPSLFIGLCLYAVRGWRTRPRLESRFGLTKEFISVRTCSTPADLADLILASSCTPPITPWYSFQGRPVLDGGISESIPLSGLPQKPGRTLVLLTTKASPIDHGPDIVSAAPSQDLAIGSWDYTSARKIDDLYALGKEDGCKFLKATSKQRVFTTI